MDNLILIGFPGIGKDSVAAEISKRTDIPVFSTDKYIEFKERKSISEIFAKKGESYFRKLEKEALKKAINLKDVIISTGGGIVKDSSNVELMKKSGKIISLKCNVNELKSRLKLSETRPLIKNEKDIEKLFKERKKLYDFADYEIDTSKKTVSDIAKSIIENFDLKATNKSSLLHEIIQIKTKQKEYSVFTGINIVDNICIYIRQSLKNPGKIILISDPLVSTLYLEKILSVLRKDFEVFYFIIKEGEENKNINTVIKIYDFLLEKRITRDDVLVALGGGIVGDITGFVASTYKRGIGLVQIPTTLLSQVDASVGGKTGINHREGKNMIGSFYQPDMIIADVSFLKTLPEEIYRAGISEIIKYGIIKDENLLKTLREKKENVKNREAGILSHIVSKCIKIKGEIVYEDEREEKGIREILNFGHTIGHIVEAETNYNKFSHGQAVAMGMVKEAEIANKKGLLKDKDFEEICKIISSYGLPVNIPEEISETVFLERLSQDKKVRNGKIKIPFPLKIGKAVIKEVLCKEYL